MIQTFDAAYMRLTRKLVCNGYEIKNVIPINHRRYSIVVGQVSNKNHNIMILYKRDPFRSFGKMFLDKSKVGDSINCEDLKIALRSDVKDIYVVFSEGFVYRIELMNFLEKSIKWENSEGTEVRSLALEDYDEEFEI